MKTTIVRNIKHHPAVPLDECVYIGRPNNYLGYLPDNDGYFGNPFRLKPGESRGATLKRFMKYFYERLATDPVFKQRVHALRGKILMCWCKPEPCHGDIIANYLNNLPDSTIPEDYMSGSDGPWTVVS